MAGKTIVFCADGTWNGPNGDDDDHDGLADRTNVLKLFLSLAGSETLMDSHEGNEREKEHRDQNGNLIQVAKYLHGVGDSANPLMKLIGGVFGSGIITRIVRGYTFLSRNYQPGDRIVLVGFSRGAYTARALSGLISDVGLLNNDDGALSDKEKAYRLGVSAWYQHRKRFIGQQNQGLPTRLMDIADDLPFFASRPLESARYRAARIEAVGVWDTVGSLGIPVYDPTGRIDTFKFANCALSDNVKFGFHAVSIDEQRADFTPTLWDDRKDVTQVLFAGAHADVGGGYPASESALSDCALNWMMQSLKDAQVKYSNPPPFQLTADPLGGSHRPWDAPPFNALGKGDRKLRAGLQLHHSVKLRLACPAVPQYGIPAPQPYRPGSLRNYVNDDWILNSQVAVVG